ncbi:hypothetical protein [Thermocoleostomius sinensis]|uniref:Uncharacterized protein n=1 Tax=Thermocoleostomius sinensis A174 TaxID=2016057 RepID=A0A9E8ZIN5_9CYAN|nr:hypothetical protein [Thermocoleostomius sinensis]WAL62444.1 hypothetical protein OXH18_10765 [Thermocoleostomius sinensis A174]
MSQTATFQLSAATGLTQDFTRSEADAGALPNRIDEEVRRNFNSKILQDRIALRMATQSEELFFEEMNERAFR